MKKIVALIVLMVFIFVTKASLMDTYKKGVISIKPDPKFAKNLNWNKLFSSYRDTTFYGKHIGQIRNITIADDGSVFISNYSSCSITKFDKDGNFIKTFGKKGGKKGFVYSPELCGILDNKYLISKEYNGRIYVYDLEGSYIKTIMMDYSITDCIPLKDNKVAVLGSVIFENGDFKHLVTLKDIETEEEKDLTYFIAKDDKSKNITIETKNGSFMIASPYSRISSYIAKTSDNNILFGQSNSNKIKVIDTYGNFVKTINTKINPLSITEKDKNEYKKKIKNKLVKRQMYSKGVEEKLNNLNFSPSHLPYYYNMLVDSEDNILICKYTNDSQNSLNIYSYSQDGKFIGEVKIDAGNYELNFNAANKRFAFYKNSLYIVVELKDKTKIPLRIIKVDL